MLLATAFRSGHRRSRQIFVRHHSLQLPHVRVRRRCGRGEGPRCGLLRDYEFGQSEQDRHNGWRYFLEETDLLPGMDADEATKLRQARLERRESGILRPVSIQNPHTR
jgi:hypothetical protein